MSWPCSSTSRSMELFAAKGRVGNVTDYEPGMRGFRQVQSLVQDA